MCRFLWYLGPEVSLSSVVIDPNHGMLQQALKAYDRITPLNADGFGVAWYVPSVSPIPACFRDVSPAWSNQNLKQIARVSRSHCIFAHVRAASMGNVMQTNCHPFCYKNITFMHNGTVPHYRSIKRKMLESVSDRAFHLIQGTTDSEMMFAMFITHFERITGEKHGREDEPYTPKDHTQNLASAMRDTLHQIHKYALEYEINNPTTTPDTAVQQHDEQGQVQEEEDGPDGADLPYTQAIGRLNVSVTDGQSSIAARYVCSHPSTAHTLYYTRGESIEYIERGCCISKPAAFNQSLVVSSEPLDTCDKKYAEVPPNHMVVAGPFNNYFSLERC